MKLLDICIAKYIYPVNIYKYIHIPKSQGINNLKQRPKHLTYYLICNEIDIILQM